MNSLTPSICAWCNLGHIVSRKCQNCGIVYGANVVIKRSKKPSQAGAYKLPTDNEVDSVMGWRKRNKK